MSRIKTPHLDASLLVLGAAIVILLGGAAVGRAWERRYLHALAPLLFLQKNQGVALQREAFAQPDLLPFYGSSELVRPAAYKAANFFRTYPTGFNVFPVARVGATSLVMLQKFAAVGTRMRGRKVVISLSPSWFFRRAIPPGYYDGNFSRLQADELLYGAPFSLELKRDVARQMLRYPHTLEKSTLLAFALRQLAKDSPLHDAIFHALTPLGIVETWILRMQDHFETLIYILKEKPHLQTGVQPVVRALDWHNLIGQAAFDAGQRTDVDPEPIGPEAGPGAFLSGEQGAHEWIDFGLLLRGLDELGARPLLLSMPIDGSYFDRFGVGRPLRDVYYKQVRALARAHHVPLVTFEEHDEDGAFLAGHHDHLSDKGWLYYDQALDDFFHDRLTAVPGS
ncbi:MAG TPA: D-alanyl-lipoteichoic acid biosynthesis protein DltD [Chthoniobacterales bacterium]